MTDTELLPGFGPLDELIEKVPFEIVADALLPEMLPKWICPDARGCPSIEPFRSVLTRGKGGCLWSPPPPQPQQRRLATTIAMLTNERFFVTHLTISILIADAQSARTPVARSEMPVIFSVKTTKANHDSDRNCCRGSRFFRFKGVCFPPLNEACSFQTSIRTNLSLGSLSGNQATVEYSKMRFARGTALIHRTTEYVRHQRGSC